MHADGDRDRRKPDVGSSIRHQVDTDHLRESRVGREGEGEGKGKGEQRRKKLDERNAEVEEVEIDRYDDSDSNCSSAAGNEMNEKRESGVFCTTVGSSVGLDAGNLRMMRDSSSSAGTFFCSIQSTLQGDFAEAPYNNNSPRGREAGRVQAFLSASHCPKGLLSSAFCLELRNAIAAGIVPLESAKNNQESHTNHLNATKSKSKALLKLKAGAKLAENSPVADPVERKGDRDGKVDEREGGREGRRDERERREEEKEKENQWKVREKERKGCERTIRGQKTMARLEVEEDSGGRLSKHFATPQKGPPNLLLPAEGNNCSTHSNRQGHNNSNDVFAPTTRSQRLGSSSSSISTSFSTVAGVGESPVSCTQSSLPPFTPPLTPHPHSHPCPSTRPSTSAQVRATNFSPRTTSNLEYEYDLRPKPVDPDVRIASKNAAVRPHLASHPLSAPSSSSVLSASTSPSLTSNSIDVDNNSSRRRKPSVPVQSQKAKSPSIPTSQTQRSLGSQLPFNSHLWTKALIPDGIRRTEKEQIQHTNHGHALTACPNEAKAVAMVSRMVSIRSQVPSHNIYYTMIYYTILRHTTL